VHTARDASAERRTPIPARGARGASGVGGMALEMEMVIHMTHDARQA
jgi:hypothetical protein